MVFSTLVTQRRLIQTKAYYKFSTLSERKFLSNIQKQQLQKTFSQVSKLLVQLASTNVFYSMGQTGRHYFFYKFIVPPSFFATTMLLRSLKKVFWKKSVFYLRYLHNNIAMLVILRVFCIFIYNSKPLWRHVLINN